MTTTPEDEAAAREYAFAENTLHRENLRAYFEQGEVKDGRVNWDIETLITLIVSEMYEARKKALLAGLSHARAESPRWVSCAEGLPDFNAPVALLSMDRFENVAGDWIRHVQAAGFRSQIHPEDPKGYWSIVGQRATPIGSFTHWYSLPPAPEKEQP